ncbi:hypothetical protein NN561_012574 [Cricetulus griseus]
MGVPSQGHPELGTGSDAECPAPCDKSTLMASLNVSRPIMMSLFSAEGRVKRHGREGSGAGNGFPNLQMRKQEYTQAQAGCKDRRTDGLPCPLKPPFAQTPLHTPRGPLGRSSSIGSSWLVPCHGFWDLKEKENMESQRSRASRGRGGWSQDPSTPLDRKCPHQPLMMGTTSGLEVTTEACLSLHEVTCGGRDLILSPHPRLPPERLSPPDNVTVVCNSSHCVVTWSQPRTWTPMTFLDFRYEVDIQRQVCISSPEENRYMFPSPEPRLGHVVSVRAGDVRSERWSVWSPLVEFGSEGRAVPRLHVYLTVVFVTLLCAIGLGLACKRFIGNQRFFPQIPEIKDKVTDDDRVNPEVRDHAGQDRASPVSHPFGPTHLGNPSLSSPNDPG